MNRYSAILLEDKELIGLNKVHKNVLKAAPDVIKSKAKIYYDPSAKNEYDEMVISSKILDFVSEGIKFDPQVVKTKAAYTLPYKAEAVHEIFKNKKDLGDDFIIEPTKYRVNDYTSINKAYLKLNKEKTVQDLIVYDANKSDAVAGFTKPAYKFQPKNFFIEKKLSSSETQLNVDSEAKREAAGSQLKSARSLNDLADDNQPEVGIFLTEAPLDELSNEKPQKKEKKVLYEAQRDLKELNEINWDDHLINLLSEGTARWIVMKQVSDANQRQRLLEIVEKKFGRYTRDIKDLELVEDNLTDFEKRKIAEEKERVRMENEKKNQVHVQIADAVEEEESKDKNIPLYRLPQGNKRAEIEKLKMPDPSYNKTARDIKVDPSRILSPKSFQHKMESKHVTDMTLFKSDNEYHLEMVTGNTKHVIGQDENLIQLDNGKSFVKTVQNVFPTEFTAWVSGIDLEPNDKPEMKIPVRGKKKWKKLPQLIDDSNINNPSGEKTNYWHLMPTTPDTQLRKILKTNLTVARVVDEWRRRWQTSNRWSLAEIDQLIKDMNDDHANVRFQAVVVCSRAAEQLILMYDKLETYNKKKHIIREATIMEEMEKRKSKKLVEDEADSADEKIKSLENEENKERETKREIKNILLKSGNNSLKSKRPLYPSFNETFFPDNLYDKIESLLTDSNNKVKLAAAIAIFTILRKFIRPLTHRFQSSKNKAELVLRQTLESYNNSDRYAAAQCLAIDGFCDRLVVQILLNNYFSSSEQVTKEQVTKSLSDLSPYNPLVSLMIEDFLDSEHARERILAIKLFPCLRIPLSKHATQKLIQLMWNDMNRSVRKCSAQTLGRTGRGQQVHDEICIRLKSQNSFDRIEALNKLNHIGIMTNELLSHYLKCFYDDYISVRELACISAQSLFEKDEKVLGALVFMARFDKIPKLKALAIRTIGLIGDLTPETRKCLLWALQFEADPHVKTESCHSIILLSPNKKDQELIDILHERHLVEEEPIVQQEIRNALDYFGFDPNKELPIVTKIRTDVKKLNDKNVIIQKIKEMEKDINFKMDKDRFIWNEEEEEKQRKKSSRTKSGKKKSLPKKQEQKPPEIFEPKQVIVSQNAKNSLDQISKYLEDTTKNSKMARSVNNSRTDKSKSKPAHFLSKLVSTGSDDRNLNTGSLRSFSGELNSNTFNEFLNANKKSNRTSSDDGYEDNDDAKSEESDNYFEQYIKAPGASSAEQINPNRSISYQTTVATISSQRIDTILEEAD